MAKPKTILIIDDDADDIQLFSEALHEVDNKIKSINASNGEEALKLLKRNKENIPDFIFLDLNMPRLNGRQSIIQLKKNPRFSDIPVIVYTTSKQREDIDEMKQLGAIHFITKPSRLDDLKNAIKNALALKRLKDFGRFH